jgi:hypothetical protein
MFFYCDSCKKIKRDDVFFKENLCLDCLYSKPKFQGKANKALKKSLGIKRRPNRKVKLAEDAEEPGLSDAPGPEAQMRLFK